jgi:AcrR family transcriptional regulator
MATDHDGRSLRGIRNRERIAEALFELIDEGTLVPTAEQVANRARVSTRSVFRHYEDMDGLFAEIARRLRDETLPALETPAGPLPDRIRTVVANRARIFERIARFKRAGETQRWRSPFLQEHHEALAAELRGALVLYLPELAEAGPQRTEIADLLTSFEAWDRMRTLQGLDPEQAAATLVTALRQLLQLGGPRP